MTRKRSSFEHKLNSRGSQPSDYARYAEYEMNLESLRRKRVQRLGVKINGHAGQRRIFFVLDRATRKHHGDLGLWMQYLGFAKQQKASKKISQILTSVLRLHPTKPELWIYAANYAMDERGDMTEARSYMQRGLRFCKQSKNLWLEYAKLEMIYMAKITARRQILGLKAESMEDGFPSTASINADTVMTLPTPTALDINHDHQPVEFIDQKALHRLSATPALSGAIPMAVFDGAMKQFAGDGSIGEQMFDMISEFENVPCTSGILLYIMDFLLTEAPTSSATLSCFIRQPVICVGVLSADFPGALIVALDRLKIALDTTIPFTGTPTTSRPRSALASTIMDWILSFLGTEDLDLDIRKVLLATLKRVWIQYQIDIQQGLWDSAFELFNIIEKLRVRGFEGLAEQGLALGTRLWPKDRHFPGSIVEKT